MGGFGKSSLFHFPKFFVSIFHVFNLGFRNSFSDYFHSSKMFYLIKSYENHEG